jgi:hypothetical protein
MNIFFLQTTTFDKDGQQCFLQSNAKSACWDNYFELDHLAL